MLQVTYKLTLLFKICFIYLFNITESTYIYYINIIQFKGKIR